MVWCRHVSAPHQNQDDDREALASTHQHRPEHYTGIHSNPFDSCCHLKGEEENPGPDGDTLQARNGCCRVELKSDGKRVDTDEEYDQSLEEGTIQGCVVPSVQRFHDIHRRPLSGFDGSF